MFDVVHPSVELPDEDELRATLEHGSMVLDVLIELGVPVTYARTRVIPSLLSPRERAGKLLGVRSTEAVLEMEELIFAGRDERVAYSRDLFAPGGIDVMVLRSLELTRPAPVVNQRAGAARANSGPPERLGPTGRAETPRWRHLREAPVPPGWRHASSSRGRGSARPGADRRSRSARSGTGAAAMSARRASTREISRPTAIIL